MKCQSLFPWNNMKNIGSLSSAEFAHRAGKVKAVCSWLYPDNYFLYHNEDRYGGY